MSYARFGCEGSDVYVFANSNDYFECQHTELRPSKLGGASAWEKTHAGMAEHLRAHVAAGDFVPATTLEAFEHAEAGDAI